jgi:mannosyltransferase
VSGTLAAVNPAGGLRSNGRVLAGLGLAIAVSLALRIGALHSGYWIDEGISVGIASHPLADIPRALIEDGSPPLYYVLLHGWIVLFGASEAATRSLSLLFALATVPAAWWGARSIFGARAGAIAAGTAAGCPFLTLYAQETRMYSLVALLSLLASASFVLAFVQGRRSQLVPLGAWLVLLLYTHNWGLFLCAGMAAAWLVLWRRGRVGARDGLLLAAAVTVLYAPWVPSVLSQAAHTGAPWSERPSPMLLLTIPVTLFGVVALPALAVALARGGRLQRLDQPARVLLTIAVVAAASAWLFSQVEPAWSARYLAVLLGPLLLAFASITARGARWTLAALALVAVVWLFSGPPPAKSNVRRVTAQLGAQLLPGDLVVSTQPEQVPVLDRYLVSALRYVTPLGRTRDPRMTDWRNGLHKLRHGHAARVLEPRLRALAPGTHVLLVTPVFKRGSARSPWLRSVRARTREWRAALRSDPRLVALGHAPRSRVTIRRSTVRAELFAVRGQPGASSSSSSSP